MLIRRWPLCWTAINISRSLVPFKWLQLSATSSILIHQRVQKDADPNMYICNGKREREREREGSVIQCDRAHKSSMKHCKVDGTRVGWRGCQKERNSELRNAPAGGRMLRAIFFFLHKKKGGKTKKYYERKRWNDIHHDENATTFPKFSSPSYVRNWQKNNHAILSGGFYPGSLE